MLERGRERAAGDATARVTPRGSGEVRQLVDSFNQMADRQVEALMARSGEVVDAIADITAPFVHQVLPDVIAVQAPPVSTQLASQFAVGLMTSVPTAELVGDTL